MINKNKKMKRVILIVLIAFSSAQYCQNAYYFEHS